MKVACPGWTICAARGFVTVVRLGVPGAWCALCYSPGHACVLDPHLHRAAGGSATAARYRVPVRFWAPAAHSPRRFTPRRSTPPPCGLPVYPVRGLHYMSLLADKDQKTATMARCRCPAAALDSGHSVRRRYVCIAPFPFTAISVGPNKVEKKSAGVSSTLLRPNQSPCTGRKSETPTPKTLTPKATASGKWGPHPFGEDLRIVRYTQGEARRDFHRGGFRLDRFGGWIPCSRISKRGSRSPLGPGSAANCRPVQAHQRDRSNATEEMRLAAKAHAGGTRWKAEQTRSTVLLDS